VPACHLNDQPGQSGGFSGSGLRVKADKSDHYTHDRQSGGFIAILVTGNLFTQTHRSLMQLVLTDPGAGDI
jgi:hypothetical protein